MLLPPSWHVWSAQVSDEDTRGTCGERCMWDNGGANGHGVWIKLRDKYMN